MLLLALLYNIGIFVIAAVLIYAIEKEFSAKTFETVLLMHAIILVIVIAAGLDGFMMIFAILDIIVVFLLHKRSENINVA
jgi:hypothetical protein